MLAILVLAIAWLNLRTHDLERQVVREQAHVADLADLLRRLERQTLTRAELDSLRDELSRGLVDAGARVSALEAGSAAASQVIARASGSIALIQGSFVVRDPATKRPLRFAVDKDGRAIRMADGRAAMTLEGSGPLVESRFFGTAFVVGRDGVLLTNRHVALPWEREPSISAIRSLGLEPAIHFLRGFLPGANEPVELRLLGASDSHDVALLQAEGAASGAQPLILSGEAPSPGDTAIVIGFPAGIGALLARAGDAFVDELSRRANVDDDAVVQALARARLIKPLASRGIIGQVSEMAVVYDAQTTSGGSGGPVLNLRGEVVAINRAVLQDFGGSNIGVPARHAIDLIAQLKLDAAQPPASARR